MIEQNEKLVVTPYLRPDLDADPLGVFKVQPLSDKLQGGFDMVDHTDEVEENRQLDKIHGENALMARKIEAIPYLILACSLVEPLLHDMGCEYAMKYGDGDHGRKCPRCAVDKALAMLKPPEADATEA
jgi:hypothetical protein